MPALSGRASPPGANAKCSARIEHKGSYPILIRQDAKRFEIKKSYPSLLPQDEGREQCSHNDQLEASSKGAMLRNKLSMLGEKLDDRPSLVRVSV